MTLVSGKVQVEERRGSNVDPTDHCDVWNLDSGLTKAAPQWWGRALPIITMEFYFLIRERNGGKPSKLRRVLLDQEFLRRRSLRPCPVRQPHPGPTRIPGRRIRHFLVSEVKMKIRISLLRKPFFSKKTEARAIPSPWIFFFFLSWLPQYLHPVCRGLVSKVTTRTLRPRFPARSRGGPSLPPSPGGPTWKLLADQASKETVWELRVRAGAGAQA